MLIKKGTISQVRSELKKINIFFKTYGHDHKIKKLIKSGLVQEISLKRKRKEEISKGCHNGKKMTKVKMQ